MSSGRCSCRCLPDTATKGGAERRPQVRHHRAIKDLGASRTCATVGVPANPRTVLWRSQGGLVGVWTGAAYEVQRQRSVSRCSEAGRGNGATGYHLREHHVDLDPLGHARRALPSHLHNKWLTGSALAFSTWCRGEVLVVSTSTRGRERTFAKYARRDLRVVFGRPSEERPRRPRSTSGSSSSCCAGDEGTRGARRLLCPFDVASEHEESSVERDESRLLPQLSWRACWTESGWACRCHASRDRLLATAVVACVSRKGSFAMVSLSPVSAHRPSFRVVEWPSHFSRVTRRDDCFGS